MHKTVTSCWLSRKKGISLAVSSEENVSCLTACLSSHKENIRLVISRGLILFCSLSALLYLQCLTLFKERRVNAKKVSSCRTEWSAYLTSTAVPKSRGRDSNPNDNKLSLECCYCHHHPPPDSITEEKFFGNCFLSRTGKQQTRSSSPTQEFLCNPAYAIWTLCNPDPNLPTYKTVGDVPPRLWWQCFQPLLYGLLLSSLHHSSNFPLNRDFCFQIYKREEKKNELLTLRPEEKKSERRSDDGDSYLVDVVVCLQNYHFAVT